MIKGLNEEELFASGHRGCAGCGPALGIRTILKAAGKNTIIANATSCMEVISTPFPETAWRVPWIHGAFENTAAIASGVDEALKMQGRRKGINVIAIAGDGGTFDIGIQALSGAIERGQNFLYVCYDNEAYMNTGVQRSSATPFFAATTTTPAKKISHGKLEAKKPLPLIVASHGVRYVATASIADLNDVTRKVQKALSIEGPTFLHLFCPCPPGWRIESSDTIEAARMAVESGVFPLYEIENGELKFSRRIEQRKPVKDYLQKQGRFKHLTEEEIQKIQAFVDARYGFLVELEKKGKVFDVLY